MPDSRTTPSDERPAAPRTRAQRQQETRAALLEAARAVFARDGFHGASLDTIATEAGFSKGAVYSNFASKGDLFLAVMDLDLGLLDGDWDPFVRIPPPDEANDDETPLWDDVIGAGFDEMPYDAEVGFGFALTTMEFFATAMRDEHLSVALRERVGTLVAAYARHVAREREADDPLSDTELATMLTAFDQGTALMVMSGWPGMDTAILRRGLRRLLQPRPDEAE